MIDITEEMNPVSFCQLMTSFNDFSFRRDFDSRETVAIEMNRFRC